MPQFFQHQFFSLSLPTRFGLPFPDPTLQPPTVLSHDEDVPTLVLRWQEDLGYHDKNLALGWGVDVPDALHAGWVVAWVVGRLDIASELTQLPTTLAICRPSPGGQSKKEKGSQWGNRLGKLKSSEVEIRYM